MRATAPISLPLTSAACLLAVLLLLLAAMAAKSADTTSLATTGSRNSRSARSNINATACWRVAVAANLSTDDLFRKK